MPILCLASSKILTPHPPLRPVNMYPPAYVAGGGHTRWLERGWGVNILEDARYSSVLYLYRILFGWVLTSTMYLRVLRRERKQRERLCLSEGAHTATLYVMVIGWNGFGRSPPTLTRHGWFFHHDGMYSRNRQSALCEYSVLCRY